MSAEILAPAGSRESLEAAVRCGADAVYLGGKALNARRNAANFDREGLVDAVRYCHIRGVKVYLTLNTLVFDDELPQAVQVVEEACQAGVDAVLVQDLAMARLIRECAPDLELHASTQMSIHNAAGARLLEQLGFSRVVLAREMSRREMERVWDTTSLELECFVHGAQCMSVSGQCYLSGMIGGRSGNRGLCAQPCRLPFKGGGKEYALSLRDLSLISRIRELDELGIAALKIEGRMKRPEYVAAAVTACRDALVGREPDYQTLEAVFSRSGFSDGYYMARRGREMFGVRGKENVESAGPVLKKLARLYKDEAPLVTVDFALAVRRGQGVELRAADRDGNSVVALGEEPQEAVSAPTTLEKVEAALNKTGGTPYTVGNINLEIDQGLMLPVSQMNQLRREALDRLNQVRGKTEPKRFKAWVWPTLESPGFRGPRKQRVRLARGAQLSRELIQAADQIVLPGEEILALAPDVVATNKEKLMVEIPAVIFNDRKYTEEILRRVKELGVAGAVAGTLGSIAMGREYGFAVHGGHEINVINSAALEEYRLLGLESATLSLELDSRHMAKLAGTLPHGILAYGHLPLMTLRNCPVGDCKSCGRSFPEIVDRMGRKFFLDCNCEVSWLYNCFPLYLGDRMAELPEFDFVTLYFTRETAEQCLHVLRLSQNCENLDGEITRGLVFRKIT